jgi:hypothetical protein
LPKSRPRERAAIRIACFKGFLLRNGPRSDGRVSPEVHRKTRLILRRPFACSFLRGAGLPARFPP